MRESTSQPGAVKLDLAAVGGSARIPIFTNTRHSAKPDADRFGAEGATGSFPSWRQFTRNGLSAKEMVGTWGLEPQDLFRVG